MGWPQITIIVVLLLNSWVFASKHGQPRGNYNFAYNLIDDAVLLFILYSGGFFTIH